MSENKIISDKHPGLVSRRMKCLMCKEKATYKYKNTRHMTHCETHKLEKMVNVGGRRCETIDCISKPKYATPGSRIPLRCRKHLEKGMVNILKIECIVESCRVGPCYNYIGEKTNIYCSKHKTPGMINVNATYCKFEGCGVYPSYNYIHEKLPIYCRKHKLENMINIKSKKCIYDLCETIPTYNYISERKGIYCKKHKLKDMVNVKDCRCVEDSCIFRGTFGVEGSKELYCSRHKTPGMFDLRHYNKCKYTKEICKISGNFNYSGESKGVYCKKHSEPGMINVNKKNCLEKGCGKTPYFNHKDQLGGVYCSKHKLEGMVSMVDKYCRIPKCAETPLFGISGKKALYCGKHKSENMVNIVIEKKCCIEICVEEYTQEYNGSKYCDDHLPSDSHLEILKRICCFCYIREESTYVCKGCKETICKQENAIVRHLKKVIPFEFTHDSSEMLQGCSRARPDIYYEFKQHCVIVEVDEKQHRSYSDSCECSRINGIVNGIGGKPVIFIRYNPDIVRHRGVKVGILQKDRIDTLVEMIIYAINNPPKTFKVEMYQLYYDDDDEEFSEIKVEDITDRVSI
jgi:hypothetical protein